MGLFKTNPRQICLKPSTCNTCRANLTTMENLTLSENAKRFMDYAVDTLNAMDGAPEHTPSQKDEVMQKIATLKIYLDELERSYLGNTPTDTASPVDPEYIAAAGHS